MEKKNRTQLVLGLLLILVASWLIATRIKPDLANILHLTFEWPMWVMFAGAVILVIGLLVGAPDMAIPACIVAGIGGILYYQNATNNWESWAYMWTLIPGFVGAGKILSGIIGGGFMACLREGLKLLLTCAILFTIFATIFNAWTIFGSYSAYVPIALLFVLGIWLIVRGIMRQK
ncbi:MAG: hypothetical protein IMZ50_07085 [Candidatus Atribacteria bacterium]|nr:hypothetical protein [Candidatus Atribacteria bacterium]